MREQSLNDSYKYIDIRIVEGNDEMILVTGATGKIGRMVLQHLLNKNVPVRAFVRNEQALNDLKSSSLEVAVGTFEDVKSIERAVEGVDRLFLVARDNPDQVATC